MWYIEQIIKKGDNVTKVLTAVLDARNLTHVEEKIANSTFIKDTIKINILDEYSRILIPINNFTTNE